MSIISRIKKSRLMELRTWVLTVTQYAKLAPAFFDIDKANKVCLQRLSFVLNYAKDHTDYYNGLLKEKTINTDNCVEILKSLPVLNKSIIREKTNSIYSDEIDLENCKWANTGGSTGEPLYFPRAYSNFLCENINQYHLLHKLMGWRWNETIVSFSGYTPPKEMSEKRVFYSKGTSNFPFGRYDFSAFYLNDENIISYVNDLNIIRPTIIRSYPSSLALFCRLVTKYDLNLSFKLKGVFVTSEQLTEEDELTIHDTLNCPIWGQYGHTEMSIFAVKPDGEKEYYASPLYGYTEIINPETGETCKVGESGEIIVTGFSLIGLPFIRYATGDLAIFGGINSKGETVLKRLQGRTVDYIIDKQGKKIFLTDFIFGHHLQEFKNIESWQLEQNEPGIVMLRIKPDVNYSAKDEAGLISHFNKVGISVYVDYKGKIKKTSRGKRIFMIQNCR